MYGQIVTQGPSHITFNGYNYPNYNKGGPGVKQFLLLFLIDLTETFIIWFLDHVDISFLAGAINFSWSYKFSMFPVSDHTVIVLSERLSIANN